MSKKKSTSNQPDKPQGPTGPVHFTKNTDQLLNYLIVNSITGPQGPIGPQGTAGIDGSQGPQGPIGPQGTAGIDGSQGPQGPIGPQGTAGIDGSQGPQGPIGPQGTAGIDGSQGPQGPIGPQGTAGIDGSQGPQGPIGPQGTAGIDGSQGPQGPIGPQGTAGIDGSQGPQGPIGPQGTAGIDGSQGPQGPIGPQGTAGINGSQGPQGTAGINGAQGPQGTAGINGAQGPQGTAGINGAQGPQGTAGINGAQGPQGTAGINGTQGPPGLNGSPGIQGPTGPSGMEAENIILRKSNHSMSGYAPLNIVVAGNSIDGFWNECNRPEPMVHDAGVIVDPQSKNIYLVGGATGLFNLVNTVQRFSTDNNTWYPHGNIPVALSIPAATMFSNKLVFAGGQEAGGVLSDKAYILDGSWKPLGDNRMPKAVAGASAVEYGGRLYVLGGRDKANSLSPSNYIQVYDPSKRLWSLIQTAHTSEFAMASAGVYKDKIYVFGGYSANATTGAYQPMSVMAYTPASNSWSFEGANTSGVMYGSSIMIDDAIYYLGGKMGTLSDYTGHCSVFNLISHSPKGFEPSLKTPRSNASAAVLNRRLFVMGGTGPTGSFKTEYIDPDNYRFYLHKKL